MQEISERRSLNDPNELRIPDIKLPEPTDKMNFCMESYKLAQANTLLSAAIKEMLMEKYSLQEKVQYLSEYIKKVETQSKEGKFPFK